LRKKALPLYSDKYTFEILQQAFGYLFKNMVYVDDKKLPAVSQNILEPYQEYSIGDIGFIPFTQDHGSISSLGFKFKKFVYSTDLKNLNDRSVDLIRDKTDLWFVDCLGYKDYSGHFNLDDTLHWIKEIRPKKAILIHMSHAVDYYELSARLPKNVVLGHDKMTMNL
jgi:phosphoribosyl 1,2-cyclic phosphate phosphodiesterase